MIPYIILIGVLWGMKLSDLGFHHVVSCRCKRGCRVALFQMVHDELQKILDVDNADVHAGATNPLIQQGTRKVDEKESGRRKKQSSKGGTKTASLFEIVWAHVTTWQFIIPQVLNLLGSVLFAKGLGSADLSVVVPLANGVSIVSNAVVEWILGEGTGFVSRLPGVICVLAGVILCS